MKYYYNKFLCILSCSLLCSLFLQSQAPAYRQFTDEDGLPSMTVYNIKQDPNGFLWMNTSKGICRFDGQEFKKYEVPGLKGQDIPYFFMDEEGIPWFYNLTGEIMCIRNDTVIKTNIKSPANRMNVYSLYVYNRIIYITWKFYNEYKAISYNSEDFSIIKIHEYPLSLFAVHEGNLIADNPANQFTLISLNDHKTLFEFPLNQQRGFIFHHDIRILSQISDQSIAYITPIFIAILNKQFQPIKISYFREFLGDTALYISLINRNELFIKTYLNSYILNLNSNQLSKIKVNDASINTIFEDRYKRKWISTANQGLFLLSNDAINIYTSINSNLASDEIECLIFEDPLLFIGQNAKLSTVNLLTNQWNSFVFPDGRRIKTILKINNNEYLIGSDNILYQLQFVKNKKYLIKPLKNTSIKGLYSDKNNEFIILTTNGIYQVSNNNMYDRNYKLISENTSLPIRSTNIINFKDTIFVSTVDGIYFIIDRQIKKYLRLNQHNLFINKFYNERDSTLWICTDNNGLLAYNKGELIDYINIHNGLPSNSVSCITTVGDSLLLLGTDNGVYVYNKFTQVGFGLNQIDGLPGKEITSLINVEGFIWIGTTKGLAAVPIKNLKPNSEQPYISISSAIAFSKGGQLEFKNELPYHANHLRFKIQTRSLISKDQLKILYKLNYTDSSWISTNNKTLEFVGLAPGKYDLQVKAMNEDGISSEKPVLLSFVINPPWWKTIWFNAFLIGTLLSGSIGITYWRQARRRIAEEKKRAIIDQMNELKQQALQNQMNPHFIFNALNAIQNFLLTNDHEKAVGYLSSFGKLIRIIFEHSKLKYISLEDELALLRHYINLEELRFGNRVKVTFKVDPNLEFLASEIAIPPLLIQPIIENAFRHGLFHLEKNGVLNILMKKEEGSILCIIEDNGVGRIKSKQINEWKKIPFQTSSGIKSTLERIQILDQGKNKMKLEIFDLYDKEGKPCGTKVILKF